MKEKLEERIKSLKQMDRIEYRQKHEYIEKRYGYESPWEFGILIIGFAMIMGIFVRIFGESREGALELVLKVATSAVVYVLLMFVVNLAIFYHKKNKQNKLNAEYFKEVIK